MRTLEKGMLVRPHDDLPRLVYADWLEENGFIDESIFLRDFPATVWYGDGSYSGGAGGHYGYGDGDGGDGGDGGAGYGGDGDGGGGGGGYGYGDYGGYGGYGSSPQLITA